MSTGCVVCGAPLRYETHTFEAVCDNCGKEFATNAICEAGHFVCDACHARAAFDAIAVTAKQWENADPIAALESLMAMPGVHMHGPEHHALVGIALLAAVQHRIDVDFDRVYARITEQAQRVPGGICGFWGNCGAAVGAGIFFAALTDTTPLDRQNWGLANRLTGQCLIDIGEVGGPRCCKRNSYLAVRRTAIFLRDEIGIALDLPADIRCDYSRQNDTCIGKRCPFRKLTTTQRV